MSIRDRGKEMETDLIYRALAFILSRAPHPSGLRFNADYGRDAHAGRLSDVDLERDLKICVILADPERAPRERITREQRTRLYEYAHDLRNEMARRKGEAAEAEETTHG